MVALGSPSMVSRVMVALTIGCSGSLADTTFPYSVVAAYPLPDKIVAINIRYGIGLIMNGTYLINRF